ncbi:hypothetical protein IGI72_003630 [Enterococcus sp. DIV1059_2]
MITNLEIIQLVCSLLLLFVFYWIVVAIVMSGKREKFNKSIYEKEDEE